MTREELYIMFNDFLNGIELKYGGNRETFINCSIRWYQNGSNNRYKNREEKKKVAPFLRSIKEAKRYNEYLNLFGKGDLRWLYNEQNGI